MTAEAAEQAAALWVNKSIGEAQEHEDICRPPGRWATTKQPAATPSSPTPSLMCRCTLIHAHLAAFHTASPSSLSNNRAFVFSQHIMEEWVFLSSFLIKKKLASIKIGSCPGYNKANLLISIIS